MKAKKLIFNGPKILLLFLMLIPVFLIDGILSIIAIVVLYPFDKLRSLIERALMNLTESLR
jgi:hypothetical protein